MLRLLRVLAVVATVLMVAALGFTRPASALPTWDGAPTDGAREPVQWAEPQLPTLYSAGALDAIANDIVGATDMKVVLEDDPAEWATIAGPESENVVGFVVFRAAPSPLFHAIFLGPVTFPAWKAWLASGTPVGTEYAFALSALSLVHEALHWRLLSGDESTVNACALKFLPYYLEHDFSVPSSITQTTYVKVAVKTVKNVPVKKAVVKTIRTKVNGKWVTRKVRTTVTTLVPKTSTGYVTQPVTTTVPNPLYSTLLADAQDFYNRQPPPYNSGVCPQ